MSSPFKFLDPFGPKDRDVFFGRDEEIEALYELALRGRLLLVYGLSGTGKTSLLQCGLRNRFNYTEWLPIFIRRGDNINHSLETELAKKAGDRTKKASLTDKVALIYKQNLRPVYLIIDQLEELFILGDDEEQEAFIQSVQELQHSGLDCQIILIIREEYLGRLYSFEKAIPSLFKYRLRVEPMNYSNVEKVISGSCAKFNITLEEPEQNIRQIIENVSGDKAFIQLPYLQVYLDSLWQAVYKRSSAKESGKQPVAAAAKENYPSLTFTSRDIDRLGKIEEVLDQFLHDQEDAISKQLKQESPSLPKQAVKPILDLFVTEEGTKRPVLFSRPEGQPVQLKGIDHTPVAQMPPKAVQDALTALDQARILRIKEQQIELAHDSLAKLIDRKRSKEQRNWNQIKKQVQNLYQTHQQKGGENLYLPKPIVDTINHGFPELKEELEPELQKFIDESYSEAERKKQEKLKQRRTILAVIATALVLAVVLSIWAMWQKNIVEQFTAFFFESPKEQVAWAYDFKNEKFGVITRRGEILGDGFVWEEPRRFQNDTAIARRNGQFYWLNKDGAISEGYSWVHPTDEGFYFGIRSLERMVLDTFNGEPQEDITPSMQSLKHDTLEEGMWLNPFQAESKYGFKNLNDEIIISPKYEMVLLFFDDLAPVKMNDNWGYIDRAGLRMGSVLFEQSLSEKPYKGIFRTQESGKQGIAQTDGTEILLPQYQSIGDFSADLAPVKRNEKWGFIDTEGREVISPKFSNAGNFNEGLAAVRVGELWGFIDKTGQPAIDPVYTACGDFSEGLAKVQQNGLWGFINKKGGTIIPPAFISAGDFSEGKAPVQKDMLWGFIDKNEEMVIPYNYEFAGNFKEGRAPVQKDGLWGYIDQKEAFVSQPVYQFAEIYSDGRARVEKEGLWGFVDLNGEEVIPPYFEFAEDFSEGRALALKDGLWGIIDSTGAFIQPNKYTSIKQIGVRHYLVFQGKETGLIVLKKDSTFAIALELPCEYESISYLQDDYLMVKKDGKWGFVFWKEGSKKPVHYIQCRYDAITAFSEDGFGRAYVDEVVIDFYINREGKMLIDLEKTE